MSTRYILDPTGKIPIPEPNPTKWGTWLATANHVLAQETIGKLWVSTVFLGIDYNFLHEGPPLLWETMITRNGKWTDYLDRYSTYELALCGHRRAIEWARDNQDS